MITETVLVKTVFADDIYWAFWSFCEALVLYASSSNLTYWLCLRGHRSLQTDTLWEPAVTVFLVVETPISFAVDDNLAEE